MGLTVDPVTECDIAICEVAVLDALCLAGRRINSVPRGQRKRIVETTSPHELYRAFPRRFTSPAELDRMLGGAWVSLQVVLPDRPDLVAACDTYARRLLVTNASHDREALAAELVWVNGG